MSRDDRIPFNDETPRRRDIDFEIGEDSLDSQRSYAATEPVDRYDAPTAAIDSRPQPSPAEIDQATKVLPAFEQPAAEPPRYDQDAPTQRIGTAPGRTGAQRRAQQAPPEYRAPSAAPRYSEPQVVDPRYADPRRSGHQPAHSEPPRSRRELSTAGWFRLLFGGLGLLVAAWLLVHGALPLLSGDTLWSLLNPFTLVGAPLLLACLVILPGPAVGKVVGILFAAGSYAALILPGYLGAMPASEFSLTVYLSGPVAVTLAFMTWLSVRGKRALAWVLVPLPAFVAIVWSLMAVNFGSLGVIYAGDWLLHLYTTGAAPWLERATVLPLTILQSTLRVITLALCVVPAMLLAWPFARAKLVRDAAR